MEHENNGYTYGNWFSYCSYKMIDTGTGWLENKRTRGDHPNYCVIKIGQYTEESLGDLRRLAPMIPSANAGMKTLKGVNNNKRQTKYSVI